MKRHTFNIKADLGDGLKWHRYVFYKRFVEIYVKEKYRGEWKKYGAHAYDLEYNSWYSKYLYGIIFNHFKVKSFDEFPEYDGKS
jgi:hypothetical protein